MSTVKVIIQKGSSKSGNYGHVGRPGLVGGSKPKGGQFPAGSAPTKYDYGYVWDKPEILQDPKFNVRVDPRLGEMLYDDIHGKNLIYRGTNAEGKPVVELPVESKIVEHEEYVKDDIIKSISEDTGIDYDTVNAIEQQWAKTSNREYESLSLQEAAAEELGVPLSDYQKRSLKQYNDANNEWKVKTDLFDEANTFAEEFPYKHNGSKKLSEMKAEWQKLHPGAPNFSDIMMVNYKKPYTGITSRENERKILRAMYNRTQAELAKQGLKPDDNVLMYRGVVLDRDRAPKGDISEKINYTGNAIESWSASAAVARQFGGNVDYQRVGFVLAMNVPVRNIITSARTGFGCLREAEFVIAGSVPGSQSTIIYRYDPSGS